jgi:hypothetical protein
MGPPSARIFLNAGRAQPRESVAVNQILPSQEFICRQHVAAASFLGRQESAANRCNDLGLASNDPALRIGMREIRNCQGGAVRPDDACALVSGHFEPRFRGIVLLAPRGTAGGARSAGGHRTGPSPGDRPAGQPVSLVVAISAVKIIWRARNWSSSLKYPRQPGVIEVVAYPVDFPFTGRPLLA